MKVSSERLAASNRKAGENSVIISVGVCLLLTLFLLPVAHAQPPAKMPLIGFVSSGGDASNPGPNVEIFRKVLKELGYIENKNISVNYRYIERDREPVRALVTELIERKVDVLVATSPSVIRTAQQATKTIPIVMVINQDAVAAGIVKSLAQPGGNVTGVSSLNRSLSGKRLELFTELVPGNSRIGVLWAKGGALG